MRAFLMLCLGLAGCAGGDRRDLDGDDGADADADADADTDVDADTDADTDADADADTDTDTDTDTDSGTGTGTGTDADADTDGDTDTDADTDADSDTDTGTGGECDSVDPICAADGCFCGDRGRAYCVDDNRCYAVDELDACCGGGACADVEICDNRIDDDCDGDLDCLDADCVDAAACAGGGVCGDDAAVLCGDGECCILGCGGVDGTFCTPVGEACIDIWDPVCGCDGVTYGNDCQAHSACAAIDFAGECAGGGIGAGG